MADGIKSIYKNCEQTIHNARYKIVVGLGKGVKKYHHMRDVIYERPTLKQSMDPIKFKFAQKLM